MFDYSKPIIPQILEYMKELEYPKSSITFAKKKMLEERDLEWTENFVKSMTFNFIGKSIMEGIDKGKIKMIDEGTS